ncbi:MAG: sugar-binding protein [Verrucomicrobiota bacterium]
MKTHRILAATLVAASLVLTPALLRAASPGDTLQRGLYAEEVEGNVEAAIKAYGQVIQNSSAPPNLVAQALYRQGLCYMKLKDEASARAAFEKLVTEYPGQTEIVDKARPMLDDLTNFDPATLMPPGTLVYVEFGSPGTQVETILNMLKGTPFENPLAAVGGSPGAADSGKNPGNIMAALLNPSMMAEFKKIRGSAVGITDIAQDNPPMVAVLYPGRSDALRGLILAALGMAGKPGQAMEGLQTVELPQDMSAAYDDKVVVLAHPASQLAWCVKQYKSHNPEPSLASSNESFARINKTQRQKNAMTLWANVDEAYARVLKMFPEGQVPGELAAANAIVDFNHIDELLITHSLEPNGIQSRTQIRFKDGSKCLPYDLIRTPNLSRAALEAVPSDAVALASFSLGQAGAAQGDKVRSSVQAVTGLDLGREIFANVEQVTLFLMPAEKAAVDLAGAPELPARAGLAITSRNPAQTREILQRLLGTLNAATGGSTNTAGRYQVGQFAHQPLYCYVDQVDGTTLLSLNPAILAASGAAIRNHKSVCTAGPLHDSVGRLDASASKLVLVNVGGAMRLAGPMLKLAAGATPEQVQQMNAAYTQLAQAVDGAQVQLRTEEAPSQFAASSALTGIPPLEKLLAPAMKLSHLTGAVRAEARASELRRLTPATIARVPAPVTGLPSAAAWAEAPSYALAHFVQGAAKSGGDLAADYQALWDNSNLYIRVNVTDDVVQDIASTDSWKNDSVELFIDGRNGKGAGYGANDFQFVFVWDKAHPLLQELHHDQTNGVQYVMNRTAKGYVLEAKLPWAMLGTRPGAGAAIGLEVEVNDNDKGSGERDRKLAWHATEDNAWFTPQAFGNAELAGLVGWWKFDESDGRTAADSSGNGNSGTLNGKASWSPKGGRIGGAIDLHGEGDYVRIDNVVPFNITGRITISAWVNIRSVPQEWTGIVTKGDSAWRMSTEYAQNAFHFGVNQEEWLNGHGQYKSGEWHHVACVYDGNTMRLWVDGKLDASRSRQGPIGTNEFPVWIGGNAELGGHCWDGLIDDVRVYNYALPDARLQALAAGADQ